MKKKTLVIIGIVIALALIGLFFVMSNKGISVKEVKIKNEIVKKTVSATGVVKAINEASLSFASLGRVANIAVEDGAVVKKGQYLATMENTYDRQSVQAMKDSRDIALRDRELFIQQYENHKDLLGGGDEYAISLRKYDELVSRAEASYQAQLSLENRTYIYSPITGTVIDVLKEEGETAVSSETIVRVADLSSLLFEIELNQEDFEFIKEGMEVEIKLNSYEDERFKATVYELPRFIDTANGDNFIVKIIFEEKDKDKIILGMSGDAYIILAQTDTEVPALLFDEIIYDESDRPYLFVMDEETVKKINLETGLQGDVYVELKTVLDKPIITPISDKIELREGQKVQLTK